MPGKKRVKCSYLHCTRNRLNSPTTPMFKVPVESERCKLWLTCMGRLDLITKPSSVLHSTIRVCADHFEEKCFTSTLRSRLHRCADPIPISTAPEITISATQDTPDMECDVAEVQASSSSVCDAQNTLELTPKRRRIRSLRVQLHRLKARAQKTAQQSMKLKDAMRTIKKAVPAALYEMVRTCVSRSGRVRHWSPEIKSKALNIYLQSPAAYRLIRKLLNFPSKPTLLRVLKTYATDVGFSEKLFDILRGACAKMSDTDKLCCLMWDEMSLKVNLNYNKNEDIVDGFERFSAQSSSGKIANQALVFMVRGICSNYKQALGYFFANQCTPGEQLVELIKQAVTKLNDIGLNVVATVCDQGGNNQKAYKLLGVNRDNPYFCVNNSTIVAFYDTPHLLKSTRNMFRKYNAHFENVKVAEWKHIEQMYEIDKNSKFRLTRLTDKEVYVTGFQVMRVRTAARALSHSVAAAIYCLSSFDKLPASAIHTAEFIGNIDKAFDSLNGRSMTHFNKPLCGAVREGSNHHQIWEEMASFFRNLKYVNSENKFVYTPSTNGWMQNLNAAKLLWQVVKDKGMHSLLMGRINQDCLENTFCIVRNRGGNRSNPSCSDFRYTFRAVAAQNMLKSSDKGNCEIDYDNVLASVSSTAAASTTTAASTSSSVDNNSANKVDPVIEHSCNFAHLDIEIVNRNAMYYTAGYLAKKVNDKQPRCNHCCAGIIDTDKNLPDNVTFPLFKEYEQATIGLQYPTIDFIQCVESMASIFDSNFKTYVSQNEVSKCFENAMQQLDFQFLSPLCMVNCKSYLISLFTRMMIHARLRKVNADLASDAVSKKRKLQKVLHQ